MTKFYLIRHGANDLVGNSIAGWRPAVHLNQEGRDQAARLAEKLAGEKLQLLYSSPLERALETAQPLAQRTGLEIRIAKEIGEVQFGEWTGRKFAELGPDPRWQLWNRFRGLARTPGGESMIDLQSRMVAFLQQLWEGNPDATIALFSHGDPLRSAILYYLGMPVDFIHRIELSPASVSLLTLDRNGPQFHFINRVV